jgi:group I intron endonuclease
MADPALTGIYEIVNLVNGKRYIGSAVSFPNRWNEHKRSLKKGNHHSISLQRAWKKYGGSSFAFREIVRCQRLDLIRIEQIYLDDLRPEYNVCKTAGSTLGYKHSNEFKAAASRRSKGNTYAKGFKHSPQVCARMGAGKVGKKRPPRTDEHRLRISASNKGHKRSLGRVLSETTRQKIAESNRGKRHSLATRLKRSSLNDDQVRQIRAMRVAGSTFKQIAAAQNIKWQLAQRVCLRQRYEWVDPDGPAIFERPTRGGWKRSAEANAKVSAAGKLRWAARRLAGLPNPKHRSPRTAEQRANISAGSRKGWDIRKASGNTARPPITEDQRDNYRASAIRAWRRRKSAEMDAGPA